MIEQKSSLLVDQVSPNEVLARIVLSPKDIDSVTKRPKDSFITLRNDENGVSFLRYDYMGAVAFHQSCVDRVALYNKNLKKPKYALAGWMEGIAGDILAIAPGKIDIVVSSPKERPEHVNVCFKKDGVAVKGIVTDAEVLDLMDELFHSLRYVHSE